MSKKIKVLIVDDSALVRKLLSECLSSDEDIEVVGSAPDPFVARDMILELNPDVITLDLMMPKMDGLTFLRKIMRYYPLPVIVVSALTESNSRLVLDAMTYGAVDVMDKPGSSFSVEDMGIVLADKIKAAAQVKSPHQHPALKHDPEQPQPVKLGSRNLAGRIVAIGASTGGTRALERVLMAMPADCPPVVVVQHMPEVFTKSFAMRLNDLCAMEVKEAVHGDAVIPGRVIIAHGNYHMLLAREDNTYKVLLKSGELVSRHRPSVNVLFKSVAEAAGRNAVGVILTGMGDDGAKGMKLMHDAGAATIAQSKESCIVFGMPGEAIECGGVDYIVALDNIAAKIMSLA
ncbi:MAG: chemotaxis response regulator protein-glutamate methylesterase [Victivallales bacterium]|nr:chemotaxis response regulator protein-glutamate methylesterase [Victivallales bacterium]